MGGGMSCGLNRVTLSVLVFVTLDLPRILTLTSVFLFFLFFHGGPCQRGTHSPAAAGGSYGRRAQPSAWPIERPLPTHFFFSLTKQSSRPEVSLNLSKFNTRFDRDLKSSYHHHTVFPVIIDMVFFLSTHQLHLFTDDKIVIFSRWSQNINFFDTMMSDTMKKNWNCLFLSFFPWLFTKTILFSQYH